MPELAYLNGTFLPIEQAKVSIEDRGFQFADGVYEVIVFHGDKPVMLEAHLQRLANSCRVINLSIDFERYDFPGTIREGVRRAGFADTMIYLQLTRGPAPRNHAHPSEYEPTVVLTFKAKPVISAEKRAAGLSVMTVPDFRWSRCDAKAIALLPNIMAKNQALDGGFDDAVFVGPEGDIREASAANLFIIKSGHLLTRQQDHAILPGITRGLILSCAAKIELPTREARITRDELMSADEVLLSSSAIEVMSVVKVDNQPIGNGRPGPLTARLYDQIRRELGIGNPGPPCHF